MHLSVLLLLAPAVSALVAEPVSPQLNVLGSRAPAGGCDYNGCRCDTTRTRKPQGQFCGTCHCKPLKNFMVINWSHTYPKLDAISS